MTHQQKKQREGWKDSGLKIISHMFIFQSYLKQYSIEIES